jgi:hypothetical protein
MNAERIAWKIKNRLKANGLKLVHGTKIEFKMSYFSKDYLSIAEISIAEIYFFPDNNIISHEKIGVEEFSAFCDSSRSIVFWLLIDSDVVCEAILNKTKSGVLSTKDVDEMIKRFAYA